MKTNIEKNKTVQIEEIKSQEEIKQQKFPDIVNLLLLLLSTNEKFDQLICKAKISLTNTQAKQIKNILRFLNTETNNSRPLYNIVKEVLQALSNNKLELYEIPKIINVIHESLKNLDSIKISTEDVGILIKFILFLLIETKTIKLSTDNYELICSIIDSSMILLNKSVEIKLPITNKCVCL